MKIAIQFSGQLRSFIQPSQFFHKNLLDFVDCDVFLSTWRTMPSQLFRDDIEDCDKAISTFCSLYNVIAIETEELTKDTLLNIVDLCKNGWVIDEKNVKIDYMVYGFYQKYRCNQLRRKYEKEYGIAYDAIMVVRPDLVLAEPFPLHLLEYVQDHLLIPAGSDWEYGTNDLLAIGNNINIDNYCDLFLNLTYYMYHHVLVHPEHLNKYNIDEYKIPVRRFPYTTHLRCRRMT